MANRFDMKSNFGAVEAREKIAIVNEESDDQAKVRFNQTMRVAQRLRCDDLLFCGS